MELLHNGIDSLKKCIDLINKISASNCKDEKNKYILKDVIIFLHHSTETMFKYLLEIKQPYLIYKDINKYFSEKYNGKVNGGNDNSTISETIQFWDAIKRVVVLYDIPLKKDLEKRIEFLNNTRNSLTHYTYKVNLERTENYISLLMRDLLNIYSKTIPEFNNLANDMKLYEDIKSFPRKVRIDELMSFFAIISKWEEAKLKKRFLETNKTEIKAKFDNRDKEKQYINCICCRNKLFSPSMSYINSNEMLAGMCEYCGLMITNDDIKLVSNYIENNENVSKTIGEDILINCFMKCLYQYIYNLEEDEQIEDELKFGEKEKQVFIKIINNKHDIVVNYLGKLVKNLISNLLYDYFEDEGDRYYSKYIDESMVNKDEIKWFGTLKVSRYTEETESEIYFNCIDFDGYLFNEYQQSCARKVLLVKEYLSKINIDIWKEVFDSACGVFNYYHEVMMMSETVKDVYVCIEANINVKIEHNDFEKVINLMENIAPYIDEVE